MKILVVDYQPVTAAGLELTILQMYPDAQVSKAHSVKEGSFLFSKDVYDVMILDINRKGGVSLKMTRRIRALRPDLLLMIYTELDEPDYAPVYFEAGANGFLSKHTSTKQFKEAFTTLIETGKFESECWKNKSGLPPGIPFEMA